MTHPTGNLSVDTSYFVPRAFRLHNGRYLSHTMIERWLWLPELVNLAFHLSVGICPYWGGYLSLGWILLWFYFLKQREKI